MSSVTRLLPTTLPSGYRDSRCKGAEVYVAQKAPRCMWLKMRRGVRGSKDAEVYVVQTAPKCAWLKRRRGVRGSKGAEVYLVQKAPRCTWLRRRPKSWPGCCSLCSLIPVIAIAIDHRLLTTATCDLKEPSLPRVPLPRGSNNWHCHVWHP